VVRIFVGGSPGTGFAIARDRVLTSLHLVGTVVDGELRLHAATIQIVAAIEDSSRATTRLAAGSCTRQDVVDYDEELDWIAIAIDANAFSGMTVPALGTLAASGPPARWRTYGFPDGSAEAGKAAEGELRATDALVRLGSTMRKVLVLSSVDVGVASGGAARGYSGAPVIVDGRVVGFLCAASQDASGRSREHTLYAIPLSLIARRLGLHEGGPAFVAAQRTDFVGRQDVLAEIDRKLAAVSARSRYAGWVVVSGGPGTGKTKLLDAWLALRDQVPACDRAPRHFIRRNTDDARPEVIVESLAEQVEHRYPAQQDAKAKPENRLAELLARVSRNELVPRNAVLELVVDGLDAADMDPSGIALPRFLPAPPPGVRFLCATRPEQLHVDWLSGLRHVHWIDLDSTWVQSNRDTVAQYWTETAAELGLPHDTVKRLIAAADGNMLHAVTTADAIASPPPGWSLEWLLDRLPQGLVSPVRDLWERCASNAAVARALGLLCAARDALPLDLLGELAGWEGLDRIQFLRAARSLLLERSGAKLTYQPRHDWIRQQLIEETGAKSMRDHHQTLADKLAAWPAPADPGRRLYALRHALSHRAEAENWADVWRVGGDLGFLRAKSCEMGAYSVEADVLRVAERCRKTGDKTTGTRLGDLALAVGRESHWLRAAPEAAPGLVWNRLRGADWSVADLEKLLRVPDDAAFLRIRDGATRESRALLRDLAGRKNWLPGCAMMPDDRRVVSMFRDGTLRIWDLDSGEDSPPLDAHSNAVTACAVMPDGRRVVSASDDKTLKVWDLDARCLVATLEGHTLWVNACAVVPPDGKRVVSASGDKTLKVWDVDAARALVTLEGHTDAVTACAITHDGQRVVSASKDGTLKVWNLDSGSLLATLAGHTGAVSACAVAPDDRCVVSASDDRTLRIWDLEAGSVLATLEGHGDVVTACAVALDRWVVSASRDRTLRVWELDGGRLLDTFVGHNDAVVACAVTRDGRRVVSGANDQTLKIWDLASAGGDAQRSVQPYAAAESHSDEVTACTVSRDGECAVSVSRDQTLKIWEFDTGRVLATRKAHDDQIVGCAVTSDCKQVISASRDCTLKIWDLETGALVRVLDGHTGGVNACVVTPDGQRAISASDDRTLKVWDLRGDDVVTFKGHLGAVTACAVTLDGRVISASDDKTLNVWELSSGRVLATLKGHTGGVVACALTPDGSRVVSGSWDQTLKVWDLRNYSDLLTLKEHVGWVQACAVTPDGKHVVSASWDKTLKVWELHRGACVLTHRGMSPYGAVAATGAGIVAGDALGTVSFLDWPQRWSGQRRVAQISNTPPRPRVKAATRKHVILFLAANPTGTTRLALDEECAAIEQELRLTAGRDDFEFRSKWAVTIDTLMQHLNDLRPTVIHFSGHGGGSAAIYLPDEKPQRTHRDVGAAPDAGIQLQDAQRQPQYVTAKALRQMIRSAAPTVRLAVLNACFSEAVANELRGEVDCVVGMSAAIGDEAARAFSVGFYRALGYRRSVGNAVEQAVAGLAARQLPDEHLPVCRTREGVDASAFTLPSLDDDAS
jgi:WD40 repeat protein